jgi:hypothetical protein
MGLVKQNVLLKLWRCPDVPFPNLWATGCERARLCAVAKLWAASELSRAANLGYITEVSAELERYDFFKDYLA